MRILVDLIVLLYLVTILWLAVYGINSLINTLLYLRAKKGTTTGDAPISDGDWPRVTIQLPIFNEKYTVERLLRAVMELDYPAPALQIQVLDDSTDDTAELVGRLVPKYRGRGVNVELLHRNNRAGYKAGALAEGLSTATGEFIGIFDADFVPTRDWLRKTVPQFKDASVGCLQTRWGHTNRRYNSLTAAEALAIDGHFLIEQTARSSSRLFLNFNGTAGLWRRACIEQAGGWQSDTLTEDLDLSYRAQLLGWRIEYMPDVVVPAELPSQVEAFKKQQFRWAKGSFQVVRKMLPRVMRRKDLPLHVRLMAALHLTGYMVHPLMLLMLLLTLPVGLVAPMAFRIFPFTFIAGFGPPLMYLVAAGPGSPSLRERARLIPLMTITGFGISLSTTLAVLQGLTGTGSSHFVRTPKLDQGDVQRRRPIDRAYLEPVSRLVWAELGLGIYALYTGLTLAPWVGWDVMPWMMIYTLGYFYIAGLNLIQHATQRLKQAARLVPE
jgi:cellulose synthase/poly-beta-1,6-N-acetylglucosamine synthase-like glycosyltransferase